ncbi:hypothetical protein EYF80_048408 [Liparis tanakae]|uniref:Uncharacterized protein n=1 Tax=Liparis tanakae TaxID=230148 RepID=A0A4Z2FKZ7_9TELE|nr:hypothetical protein EYF80_048408 [Liparis tanakae]
MSRPVSPMLQDVLSPDERHAGVCVIMDPMRREVTDSGEEAELVMCDGEKSQKEEVPLFHLSTI